VHEFDFAAGKLHVRRTWDDVDGEQDGGKSDAARRDLPIITALRGELRDHLMRTGRRGVDLVFGEDGVPFCPSTVRRRARERWEAAKLEPITMHSARHSFASIMIAAGVDAKAIQTYMGHSSITVTYDTYGHLFEDAAAEATRRADAYLAAQAAPGGLRVVE
jgi:integrase